jgi:hypothetical protein
METTGIYALVQNGIVINTIVWDGNLMGWRPPENVSTVLLATENASVSRGWTYDGERFDPPLA